MGSFELQKVSVLIFWCFISPCLSTNVQFFDDADFKGYKYEVENSGGCVNLPEYTLSDRGSVKTTGCIVLFTGIDCNSGIGCVVQSDVRDLVLQLETVLRIKSFRNCNVEEKSSEVNVEIFVEGEKPKPFNFTLSFKDVCMCSNLPKFIRQSDIEYTYANGWGKCMIYYRNENCQGRITSWPTNGEIAGANIFVPVTSFKPCVLQSHCVRLNAIITVVEPLTDLLHLNNLTTTFAIAATETFQNNGSGTLEEDYSVEKDVNESFHFGFANEFSQMNSLTFDMGVKIEGKASFWGRLVSASAEIQAAISLKYQTSSSSTETKEYGIKKTTKFKAAKQISVPACTEYTVSSFVKVAKDVNILYRVEFKIMGVIQGDTRMKAVEIREHLNGLKYLRDLDEFTVVAETTAQMKATFGLETFTKAEGTIIDACVKENKKCSCNNINDLKMNYVLLKNQVKNTSSHFWKRS